MVLYDVVWCDVVWCSAVWSGWWGRLAALNCPISLLPYKVIASSNHLGNNDMLNLTTKKTLDAKMRVKNNIFAPWKEDINHEVRPAYQDYPKMSAPFTIPQRWHACATC